MTRQATISCQRSRRGQLVFRPMLACRRAASVVVLVAATAFWLAQAHPAVAQGPTATPGAELPQQPLPTASPTLAPPPTETPRPTDTARPTDTPRPTPRPSNTPGFPFPPPPSATSTAKPTASPTDEGLAHVERPIVVISGFDVDPQNPAPDTRFHLQLNVANEGEHDAENIQITLGGDSFLPVAPGGVLFINQLKDGDDTSVEADLTVATGVEAGTHSLSLALRWDDSYGGSYSDQQSIGIEVGGAGTRRPLLVLAGSKVPGRVAPGAPFSVVLDLLNSGGTEARNVIAVPTGGPLALQGSGGSPPATIGPGAHQTILLRVQAGQVADPGAVSQAVELRYDDPNGQHYTDQVTVGLAVTDDAAYGPLPMVMAYTVEPAELHPGQVFDLVLQVTNVGVADALRTRLAIGGGSSGAASGSSATTSSSGVFAPLATSNLRFLNRLKVDEVRELRQKMVVDGSAKPGNYTLSMAFVFFDADGKAQESSEVVSLLVTRPVDLQINATGLITSTFVGDVIPLNLEILNAGLATVNGINLDVKVSALLGLVEGAPHFVGSLDSGSPDTAEVQLEAKKAGSAEATVVVSYLDDQNRAQRVEKTFTFQIEELPAPSADDLRPASEEGNVFMRILKGLFGLGASPRLIVPSPGTGTDDGTSSGAPANSPRGGRIVVQPASPAR